MCRCVRVRVCVAVAVHPWLARAEYDTWQVGNVLGPNPTPADIQTLGNNITARLQANLLANPIHGVFLGVHNFRALLSIPGGCLFFCS